MGNDTGKTTLNFHFLHKGSFTSEKEEHLETKPYLDFLAHYDAQLVPINGDVVIVRREGGAELPLERRGKQQMVQRLLHEFGTVDEANTAIGRYKALHS
jgi:hypothetical protein